MTTTHQCPIEGCRHDDVAADKVACHKHWAMVPRDLQNSCYRWAKVSAQRRRLVPEHIQAIRSAIESVNDQCRRSRLKEDNGINALSFPVWFDGNTRGMR